MMNMRTLTKNLQTAMLEGAREETSGTISLLSIPLQIQLEMEMKNHVT